MTHSPDESDPVPGDVPVTSLNGHQVATLPEPGTHQPNPHGPILEVLPPVTARAGPLGLRRRIPRRALSLVPGANPLVGVPRLAGRELRWWWVIDAYLLEQQALDGIGMQLGPAKSKAGRRTIAIPAVIIHALVDHLDKYVKTEEDAFVFLGAKGGFLRGNNFRRSAKWETALKEMGLTGLHFHDLRHTGNTLAAQSGASLADLKARMGHDSDRAALIYQHATQDADRKIADALSARVKAERKKAKKIKRS
ncbi:tyrosine-type recombinase/integrase [Nonomuraea typhae]|uniref:tyrosine-type recombinase/integrase n=1 Tax=Nonomuraea typhae TaxID=2603600 RepID=UPI0012FADE7E|nr:tyrosine-type recombinase/integrase [Nonomuraea typhae]